MTVGCEGRRLSPKWKEKNEQRHRLLDLKDFGKATEAELVEFEEVTAWCDKEIHRVYRLEVEERPEGAVITRLPRFHVKLVKCRHYKYCGNMALSSMAIPSGHHFCPACEAYPYSCLDSQAPPSSCWAYKERGKGDG